MNRSRRDVLLTFGALAAGAVATGVGTRLCGPGDVASAGDRAARTIYLETREALCELAPGRTIRAMTYNGQVPGPEIRAREGESGWLCWTRRLTSCTR